MGTLRKENLLGDSASGDDIPPAQTTFLDSIKPLVVSERTSSLVIDALEFALAETHVMVPTRDRLFHTFRALLIQGINQAIAYDENHPDFPMNGVHMEKFAKRWLLHALMWSFCGSAPWEVRKKFSDMLTRTSGVFIPGGGDHALFDYRVRVEDGELELWSSSVPRMEIESHRVSSSDVVIATTDTLRHSDILGAWLHFRTPLILCGPPGSDSGRFEMPHRFLRHVPLLLVDFPETDSLMQIYRTFNGGMLKMFPNLKGETDALTRAMVKVYSENQKRFTPDMLPQYFYSPRELSRWVRGIYEAIVNMDQGLTGEELVRIWAHEGLRLFADRLVEEDDRKWCNEKLDEVARKHFAHVDFDAALARPLFYTNWVSKDTRRIERNELKEFLSARLRVFHS